MSLLFLDLIFISLKILFPTELKMRLSGQPGVGARTPRNQATRSKSLSRAPRIFATTDQQTETGDPNPTSKEDDNIDYNHTSNYSV